MPPAPTPSFPLWRRALQRVVEVIPHTQRLDLQVVEVDDDGVTFHQPWQSNLCGDIQRELVHSGVLSMLLDTASGAALLPALPTPEICPTLDLHVSHRRPATAGQGLWVRARAVEVTQSLVFTEAEVWQQPGVVIARATGHFMRLGERNTPPDFAMALFEGLEDGASDETASAAAVSPSAVPASQEGKLVPELPLEFRVLDSLTLDSLNRGRESGDISAWLEWIPYAQYIGVRAAGSEEPGQFVLEPRRRNIGNFMLPALHGGVVAAFMETAAALSALQAGREPRLPRLVDVTLDYLRSAEVKPTHAQCWIEREGRRMAHVRVKAWQDDDRLPVASARVNFLLGDL
ncbi:PaaI family thioesterase [Halomonas cupida]|uniref:PaaI family thioesterase n=1 Tax=Halomonas cupida TaxID=44933 RepID=UPI003A90C14F